jgi:glycosyltransferase involved in cell wall biosynthesis
MVATDKYTHTQTLDPGIAHLVPATVSGMAEGILKLLNDREYATRLADEAMKKADKLYSDRVYLFRVSDFYSNVFRRVTRYSKTAGQCSTTTHA